MKQITLLSALFLVTYTFSQTPKKDLTGEEKRLRLEQYKEYLKKQNRKRDSIYKMGAFSETSYKRNNDSDIINRVLHEEELKRAKRDSINNVLIPKK